jgi:hypothetical protein
MPNPRHLIHRRSLGGALATLAVLALPAPQGAGAAPSIGGFSVRPAESNPSNPATRAYFVQSLARGRFVRDAVAVSNLSSAPLRLRVYPVDGVTGVTSGRRRSRSPPGPNGGCRSWWASRARPRRETTWPAWRWKTCAPSTRAGTSR